MTIIVAGTIGRSGLGGQAWAVLQYLLGLRSLGHDVYYLEDCGRSSWVYVWESEDWTHELDYPAAYVHTCLEPFGFGNRWIYRDNYRSVGMPLPRFLEVCAKSDLLLMRAAPFWNWRQEYDLPVRRAFLDVDPGFTQITLANGDAGWVEGVSHAERRFTLAQRMDKPDCSVPHDHGPWLPTLPPVYLPEWPVANSPGEAFTAIIRWQGFREVTFRGVSYGQRDKEFPRFFDLPDLTRQPLLIAGMGVKPEVLSHKGWGVIKGEVVSKTPQSYREFIQNSRAEFSVPKNAYVKMKGGWFSDRSVCYLASGKPVLIEDTGLDWLGNQKGIVTFTDLETAARGIDLINNDYASHSRAARKLAQNLFATDKVLPALLETAMQ